MDDVLTFTTEELAAIFEIDPQKVRDSVKRGVFEPFEAGGKGRGQTHLFRGQQALGLAVLIGMQQSEVFKPTMGLARQVMAVFGSMPDDTFILWATGKELGVVPTMWAEEKTVAWKSSPAFKALHPPAGDTAEDDDEDTKMVKQATLIGLQQVRNAVLKRIVKAAGEKKDREINILKSALKREKKGSANKSGQK